MIERVRYEVRQVCGTCLTVQRMYYVGTGALGHFRLMECWAACLTSALQCVSSALVVLERQDLALAREVIRSLLFLGGIGAAGVLRWDAVRAVWLFGLTGTVSYGVYGWITWYAIRRHDVKARP